MVLVVILCMDLTVCSDVTYAATDSWSYENSWDIVDASGAILASGNDNSGVVGTCVGGCTDETACNYSADAEQDDGSCTAVDCNGDCGGTAEDLGCGCGNAAADGFDCDGILLNK